MPLMTAEKASGAVSPLLVDDDGNLKVSGELQATIAEALPAGTNLIGHVIVDSAGNVAISSLPALPAGANVIGHVIVDSGSALAITSLPSLPTGSATIGAVTAPGGGALGTEATLLAIKALLPAALAGSGSFKVIDDNSAGAKEDLDNIAPGIPDAIGALAPSSSMSTIDAVGSIFASPAALSVTTSSATFSSTSFPFGFIVQASSTNTSSIWVGTPSDHAVGRGVELAPGDSVGFRLSNTNRLAGIAVTGTQSVSVCGVAA